MCACSSAAGPTRAGTAPRTGSPTRSTASSTRSQTTCCTTATPTRPCAGCSTRGSASPGERVQGLRDLMSRLRQRRQAELDRYDLGGAYREIAEELEEVLAEERDGLQELSRRGAGLGRRAAQAGHRRGRRRAPHAARAAPRGPRGPGEGASGLRVRVVPGAGALRGAPRTPARAGGEELVRPDVRGAHQPRPRAPRKGPPGPGRAQPDDRAARGGRTPRSELRAVHGAVRRHVPG